MNTALQFGGGMRLTIEKGTGMAPRLLASVLILPIVLVGSTVAAPKPPAAAVQKMRLKAQSRIEQRDGEQLLKQSGINFQHELLYIEQVSSSTNPAPELRRMLNRYETLAADLDRGNATARRVPSSTGIHRLLCLTHEALVTKTPSSAVMPAEWLRYARSLERFDYALGALKRAEAYKKALSGDLTARQEEISLRGYQHALVVADQLEPGKYADDIISTLDEIRQHFPSGVIFREALLRMGDYMHAIGKRDDARRYYTECFEKFGERALAAKVRLQNL